MGPTTVHPDTLTNTEVFYRFYLNDENHESLDLQLGITKVGRFVKFQSIQENL